LFLFQFSDFQSEVVEIVQSSEADQTSATSAIQTSLENLSRKSLKMFQEYEEESSCARDSIANLCEGLLQKMASLQEAIQKKVTSLN
jgi:hypothetical protein